MNLNQRDQQAEQVSAPREAGVPLAVYPQRPLFPSMPKQPERPKSYLELKQEREREEGDAILDAHWTDEHEEEEYDELAD